MMGLRAKVIFGLILFFVIFGLKFLCANCQQVVPDVIVEDKMQPQVWHSKPTELAVNDETSDLSSFHDPTQIWTSENFVHRRRRPGARKRRRRPQGLQTTEVNDLNNYWQGQTEDESLTDSAVRTTGRTKNYLTSTVPTSEGRQKPSNSFFARPTNRIERIREPLAALEQEQRLSELRTKQRKIFTTEASVPFRDKSYRKPYSQAKRQGEISTGSPNRSGTDLKDILKNSGGLSLSEILQQKNLSLDDLIKGKQNALLALQTPATPVGSSVSRLPKPVRRIPISYLSTASPHVESSTPEIFETSFSTLNNDLNSFTNENVSSEVLADELTTITTLPENPALKHLPPKHFEGVRRIRPNPTSQSIHDQTELEKEVVYHVLENHVTSTKSPVSTYPTRVNYRKRLTIKPTYKITTEEAFSYSDPSPSEKHTQQTLHTQSSQESVEEKIRQTEPETNIIEKFATFEEAKLKDVATIEELFSDAFEQENNSQISQSITPRIDGFTRKSFSKIKPDVTESNPSLFTDVGSEQTVDDRTDILELLEDRRSGGRLHKILAQRNMTLDELIQHRQRGSSQLHLSEIVQNKTGSTKSFSIRPQVLDEKLDIVTAFDNFPHFNLGNLKSIKPDEIKTDSQGSSYFTSIIDIKPTDEIHKDSRAMKSLKISADPVETLPTSFHTSGEDKSIDFYPQPWKMFALPVSYNSRENNYIDQPAEVSAAQVAPPADVDTYDPAAQIEDEVARAHDLLDLELSGHGFRRSPIAMDSTELPVGVRSAIIASALIVIISIVIFLVIFAVCRWKQKQRKKLNYAENYNAIKNRLPVISRQSTMKKINPIASPIIFPGSKNNRINTMDPNSPEVQEYLFDTMRKPF